MSTETAKTGTKQFGRAGDVRKVPLDQVRVEEGFNKRSETNYGDIEGLANSLQDRGQLDPAIGYFDRETGMVVLTTGHRRHRAWGIVGERTGKVPEMLFMFKSSDPAERLVLQFSENLTEPNTEFERALIVSGLADLGQTKEQIVKSLGVSLPTYYSLRNMMKYPEPIKEFIRSGSLSGTTAAEIFRAVEKDEAQFVEKATEAVNNAQQSGKKKATARHATVGATRTTAAIMKVAIKKLEEKVEAETASDYEAFALGLMQKLTAKVSDRNLNDFIRKAGQ